MKKPSRYFIQYADPAYKGEIGYDRGLLTEDVNTIDQARYVAAARSKKLNTHVAIYERRNIEQIEPPYGPWVCEEGWIEDGLVGFWRINDVAAVAR